MIFPWAKRVCTRVCVYPTHVYVLKHLKKYKTPYFRAEIAGFTCWSPVSARGPTVPNQLPTKKLLWERYKKTSKGRPKGGEKREKGYYTKISPWSGLKTLVPSALPPFCIGNPYFLVIWCSSLSYDILEWVLEGDLLEAWGGTDPEGGWALSLQKRFRWYFSFFILFYLSNKETRLVPETLLSLC